ncbi:unnamed protein product [Ectocarpus sp. CCAP 1310/34]|nr:unnamed protein product [Ectocarpus sp. CCAP 1310/34]
MDRTGNLRLSTRCAAATRTGDMARQEL